MKTFVNFGRVLGLALAFATLFTSDVNGAWNSAQTWVVGDGLGPTGTRIIIDRNLITTGNGGPGNISTGGAGGEFRVNHVSGGVGTTQQFYTFCMQSNENIYLGQTVRVAALSSQSVEPPVNLAEATSVLYREYLRNRGGSIFGQALSLGSGTNAVGQTVQKALWYFQGQGGGVNNTLAQAVTTFMSSVAYTGLTNAQKASLYGGVQIMNLVQDGATPDGNGNYTTAQRRQDMLIYSTSLITPVPEPTTAALFFTGLVGYCGFYRRRSVA